MSFFVKKTQKDCSYDLYNYAFMRIAKEFVLNLSECCNKHITGASHLTDLKDARIHESIKEGKVQI